MLRIAIVSGGPSAKKTWPQHGKSRDYHVIIAVNRGYYICDPDWLVAGDAVTYSRMPLKNKKVLLCLPGSIRKKLIAGVAGPEWAECANNPSWVDIMSLEKLHRDHPWDFSFPAALALADHLVSSGTIHIYGHDMTVDESEPSADRSPSRWEKEARHVEEIKQLMPQFHIERITE